MRVDSHAIEVDTIATIAAILYWTIDSDNRKCHSSHMIKRIKFIGIPVGDQERALEFYTHKLGFRILTDQQFTPTQRWIELSIPGAETGIALFTPEGHEDRIGTFVNTSWEVDNVERTYEELLAKGVEF